MKRCSKLGRGIGLALVLGVPWGHAPACPASDGTVAGAGVGWVPRSLGDAAWSGHTLALTAGARVLFLHGRDVTIHDGEGSFRRHRSVLPMEITPQAAAASGPGGDVFMAGGPRGEVYRVSTADWSFEPLPALPVRQETAALRLALGPAGALHAAWGFPRVDFQKLQDGRWIPLADVTLVNRLGRYSAGLHPAPGGFFAFGDHHLGYYNSATDSWDRLVGVFRLRPASGRGGMSAQHPDTGDLYVTLGKGSNALGRIVGPGKKPRSKLMRRSQLLRPRLPVGLDDSGETLFFTRRGGNAVLNLVSPSRGQWWSIPASELVPVLRWAGDADGWQWLPGGELVREKDSITNMVHLSPYVYIQRKNRMRSFLLDTGKHSSNKATFHYGKRFIGAGAAAATDGVGRIFLCTGHDRSFYALHLRRRADGQPNESGALLEEVADMQVAELAPLPEAPSGNTAFVWNDEVLFALLSTSSRQVHRYEPEADRWSLVTELPDELPYDVDLGADLLAIQDRLLALGGNRAAWLDPGTGRWSTLPPLAFTYSSDGGMAAADLAEGQVYVVIGGATRNFGVISLTDGSSQLWKNVLPDLVSVHGRRLWITESGDQRHLYVYRGHDSAELWRHSLPFSVGRLDHDG